MAAVVKSKPAYAVLIAKAHTDLIRKHREGYTSSSLYFHLVKQYPSVTRKGLAAALAKMAANGQAAHEGIRWKVEPSARKKLIKGKSKKTQKRNVVASGYLKFCAAKRAEIVGANPALTFGEVAKALGQAWKQLSAQEKAAFAAAPAPVAAPAAPAAAAPAAAPVAPVAAAPKAGRAKKADPAPAAAPAVPVAAPKAGRAKKSDPAPVRAAPKAAAKKAGRQVDPRVHFAEEPAVERLPHKWQYEDNGWRDYDKAASNTVEQHWREFQADSHSFDVRSVHSGSFDYQVDFKSMKQTNISHEAHTVRNIRRVAC